MRSRCTLLIDGNWLMQSRFHVLSKKFKVTNPDHIKEGAMNELVELMARSINLIINKFPCIDNMILVSDGGSWRKQLQVPKQLGDQTYKGTRKRESEFDWKYVYNSLNVLNNIFTNNDITTSQAPNMEGDDWIWYWSKKLTNDGTNVLIWSIDNDLKQLVSVNNNNGAVVMWYNNDPGLYIHEQLNTTINPIDFFMTPEIFNPVLEDIKKKSQKVTYINPNDIITTKIICGDQGDNIRPVFTFMKGSRHYKITEKDWSKFSKILKISTVDDLINHKKDIATYISKYSKYIHSGNNEINDIVEMINYNINLVWLHENIIPSTIVENMNQVSYNICDMNYLRKNFRTLMNDNIDDIKNIFEGI